MALHLKITKREGRRKLMRKSILLLSLGMAFAISCSPNLPSSSYDSSKTEVSSVADSGKGTNESSFEKDLSFAHDDSFPFEESFSDSSNESQSSGVLENARLLKGPEADDAPFDYREAQNKDYISFKRKLQSFAAELSDLIANRIYKEGENIAFSPLSIEMCLGLAIRCAGGETREELLSAIGVDYTTFNHFYSLFFRETCFESHSYANELQAMLRLANSIWVDDDVILRDLDLEDLANDYFCYSHEADFDGNNKMSNEAIAAFIKEKTNGMLNPELSLSPNTLFVLMNTLYLKDIWNGDGGDLSLAPSSYRFVNQNGNVSVKDLLSGHYLPGKAVEEKDFSYFFTSTYDGMIMTFLKPNEGQSAKIIFTKENIDKVLTSSYITDDSIKKEHYFTNCIFPEFTAECDMNLNQLFVEDLHIVSLFDNKTCDFSNVTDREDAYVDEIRHISKLEVDKKGIEGAAVTYMALAGSSAPDETWKDVYENFVVDKEFGFILSRGDAVAFSGIITNID